MQLKTGTVLVCLLVCILIALVGLVVALLIVPRLTNESNVPSPNTTSLSPPGEEPTGPAASSSASSSANTADDADSARVSPSGPTARPQLSSPSPPPYVPAPDAALLPLPCLTFDIPDALDFFGIENCANTTEAEVEQDEDEDQVEDSDQDQVEDDGGDDNMEGADDNAGDGGVLIPPIDLPELPDLPDIPSWLVPSLPDALAGNTSIPIPPNLTSPEAWEQAFQDWLAAWTVDEPEDFLQGQPQETFPACSLPREAHVYERARQILSATLGSAPSDSYVDGIVTAWADVIRLEMGITEVSRLSMTEALRGADDLSNRRKGSIDELVVLARLLVTQADRGVLPPDFVANVTEGALRFSYWLDDFRLAQDEDGAYERCLGDGAVEPLTAANAFLDEGDLGDVEYWGESEALVLHAAQHLFGHALEGCFFPLSRRTGAEQMAVGAQRILRWLDYRLSPSLGLTSWADDDALERIITTLATLADISPHAEVRLRSAMALDVILFEAAVHSVAGVLPLSRGARTGGLGGFHKLSNVLWLVTGEGTCLLGEPASSALVVAQLHSTYTISNVVSEAYSRLKAGDVSRGVAHVKGRSGVDTTVKGAAEGSLGLGLSCSVDDCEYWMSVGAAGAPETAECPYILGEAYGMAYGPLRRFAWAKPIAGIAIPSAPDMSWGSFLPGGAEEDEEEEGGSGDGDGPPMTLLSGASFLLGPVSRSTDHGAGHMVTYRTPHVLLSSLVNYKPGALLVEHRQPWTAVLDGDAEAIVFSHQPARPPGQSTAYDWWSRHASLPKVGQHENMLIAIYNPPVEAMAFLPLIERTNPPTLTHAFFDRDAFDEYASIAPGGGGPGRWHVGRKGRAYIALYSYQRAAITTSGPFMHKELIAEGRRNVWIAHVEDESTVGSFDTFKRFVSRGKVEVDILNPGLDRDGGLPFCLWQNHCIQGFPDQIDYWHLVKCVQWIPFVNPKPVCDHTLNTMQFVGCFLGCDLPDWRLCLIMCAVKAIDWSIPSATFGRVTVKYTPWRRQKMQYSWHDTLVVGRRWNAVRNEPVPQEFERFDTPFSRVDFGRDVERMDMRAGRHHTHLDFGDKPKYHAV